MDAHHHLGFRILVGESLRHVAEHEGKWLALLGRGAAAFKWGPRDAWIGWTKSQHWRRLRHVANNLRFLILPGSRRQPSRSSASWGSWPAHSPIARKLRLPARLAQIAKSSTFAWRCRIPLRLRGSGTRPSSARSSPWASRT